MYWNTFGRARVEFWDDVTAQINYTCNSNYTGNQCRRKFSNLVTSYYVSKYLT